MPIHQKEVECQDGHIIEAKTVTGGVNASRIVNTIINGFDANIPRMIAFGK